MRDFTAFDMVMARQAALQKRADFAARSRAALAAVRQGRWRRLLSRVAVTPVVTTHPDCCVA